MTSANLSLTDKLRSRKKYISRTLWTSYLAILIFAVYHVLGVVMMVSRSMNYAAIHPQAFEVLKLEKCRAVTRILGIEGIGWFFVIITALMFAFQAFSYVFNQSKMDFYLSQPTTRGQRIRKNYFEAIFTFVAIYVITEMIALIIALCMGAVSAAVLISTLIETLRNLILFLTVYNVTVLAIMLTGSLPIAMLLTAFFGIVSIVIGVESSFYQQIFFKTYSWHSKLNIWLCPLYDRYMALTAISRGISSYGYDISAASVVNTYLNAIKFDIDILVVGIIALIFVMIFSKLRRAEWASKSIAFRPFRWALKVLISVLGGLLAGYIVYMVYESVWSTKHFVMMAIIMVIASFIVGCICEVILEGNVRRTFKGLGQTVMAMALVLLVFIIYRGDLLGYDSYIPSKNSIKSCAIVGLQESSMFRAYSISDQDHNYINYFDNYDENNMVITDLDNFLKLASYGMKQMKTVEPYNYDYYQEGIEITVLYRLKNGMSKYRTLYIPYDTDPSLLASVIDTEAFKKGAFPCFGDDVIREAVKNSRTRLNYSNINGNVETLEVPYTELSDAYRQDILDHYNYELASTEVPIGRIIYSIEGDNSADMEIPVYEEFTNLISLLKKYDAYLENEMDVSNIRSVVVTNYYPGYDLEEISYSDITEDYIPSTEATYSDPDQIKEILEGARSDNFMGTFYNYTDTNPQYFIQVNLKDLPDYYSNYFAFYKGRVPEFVVQDTN